MSNGKRTKVLIVDDSAIVRKILSDALAGEPDLEVVGTAPDPYVARDKILALRPDVLTLDIEMPRMDGLTFLRKLMHFNPMPVVVISSLAQPSCRIVLDALESGAVEVLAKPSGPYSVGDLRLTLASKLRAAAVARIRKPNGAPPRAEEAAPSAARPARPVLKPPKPAPTPSDLAPQATTSDTLIAIGASTGGTEAIAAVLTHVPKNSPPILIAQHIPPVFSRAFANRLNDICAIYVKEAEDGDLVRPGQALIAPGDFHMVLRKSGGRYSVEVKTGPRVCYQRPSVDVLFQSVVEASGGRAVGVLLTGMGADGAQGLSRLRQAGAFTIAQDEATCVVFGMPREAIKLNGASQVLPLGRIAQAMLSPRSTRN
jgi:two-component system chemotaxis response regulator CheB